MTLALPTPQGVIPQYRDPFAEQWMPPVRPTEDVDSLVKQLDNRLTYSQPWLDKYDAYMENEQPLRFMQPELQKELGDRITELSINWPRLGVQAYENRLDLDEFRYPGIDGGDQNLRDVWQANNLDEQSQEGNVDTLALSRSYGIVGAGDSRDDAPVVTVESAKQVTAIRDPRTRQITAALKRWNEADNTRWATLYQPDVTRTLTLVKGQWMVTGTDLHYLGRCPVVAFAHQPRILRPDGRSLFHDIIGLADAANKMATDMMVSGEFHAMPRRWAFGLESKDFIDKNGRPMSSWSAIAGRLWANKNTEVKVGQFPEADLTVFHNTIKLLAQLVSQLIALPPHYMSFVGDNPASADAIKSAEIQLVKRVERMHTYLGGAWEEAMRVVLRIQTGKWDPKARSLESVWRDPSTPTVAQRADAIVKLATPIQGGKAIMPLEMARMELGWSEQKRQLAREMDDAAANDPVVNALAKNLLPPPAINAAS